MCCFIQYIVLYASFCAPYMRQDKDGNVYYNYGINGIAVSATVSIVLTGGTNQASVTINPNFSGNTLTMNGYLVPYNESSVFQGTTW